LLRLVVNRRSRFDLAPTPCAVSDPARKEAIASGVNLHAAIQMDDALTVPVVTTWFER